LPNSRGRGRRRPIGRKRPVGSGIARARVLIVCEGQQTEPRYFEALCRRLGITRDEVVVSASRCGSHPMSVVECACRVARAASKGDARSQSAFDSVWCVFDRDDHDNVDVAMGTAQERGFRVAFSNPCFELWFLLHFEYSSAEMTSADACARLRRYIPNYGKSSDVLDLLIPQQRRAAINAQRLRRYHLRAQDPPSRNPSTTVDRLVTELMQVATADSGVVTGAVCPC